LVKGLSNYMDDNTFNSIPWLGSLKSAYFGLCNNKLSFPLASVNLTSITCVMLLKGAQDLLPLNGSHPLVRFGNMFPGPVSNYTVTSLAQTSRTMTISKSNYTRWHSTGWYALPGAELTVTVSDNAVDKILVRIGAQSDTLYDLSSWDRFPSITYEKYVKSNTSIYRSYFGGLIYINLLKLMNTEDFTVTIVGATVLAPYFKLGVTSVGDWVSTIRNYPAPYGEIEGDLFVSTVRSEYLRNIQDPTLVAVMQTDMINQMDYLSNRKPVSYKERCVVDKQISVGYLHNGYPIMGYEDQAIQTSLTTGKTPIEQTGMANSAAGNWGIFHENVRF